MDTGKSVARPRNVPTAWTDSGIISNSKNRPDCLLIWSFFRHSCDIQRHSHDLMMTIRASRAALPFRHFCSHKKNNAALCRPFLAVKRFRLLLFRTQQHNARFFLRLCNFSFFHLLIFDNWRLCCRRSATARHLIRSRRKADIFNKWNISTQKAAGELRPGSLSCLF